MASTEMCTDTTMRAAAAKALPAFVGLIIILLNAFFPDASIQVQPSTPSGSVSEFVRATNQNTQQVLPEFAGDSLFILGYVTVYTGLQAVTAPQNRPLGLLGLNADLLAAILNGLKTSSSSSMRCLRKAKCRSPNLTFR